MTRAVWLGLLGVLIVVPAHAELPGYVLDKDYQNCLGGDGDPARATYCACIREGMRSWDEDAYLEAATQTAAANGDAAKVSGNLATLAKECITKALQ